MEKIYDIEKILKVLANRRRLVILKYLQKRHADVSGIAEHCKISLKAASKHLRILAAADFVSREQSGFHADYCLKEPLHKLATQALAHL